MKSSTVVALAVGLCACALIAWALQASASLPSDYNAQVGDVLFQALPREPLVNVIEASTESPFSHCGLVAERGGELVVLEALGVVRETPIRSFLQRGRGGAFTVARFAPPFMSQLDPIIASARSHLGKAYDGRYDWDDEAIYCSELIVKAVEEGTGEFVGQRQTLGDLVWQPHEEFIRAREGGALPLERVMVTPRALAEWDGLVIVAEQGWE